MPSQGSLGSYAVNLPSIFQSPAEALQQATVQKERNTQQLQQQGEKLQEMGMAQAKLAREEAAKKQAYLQETLDPSKYVTGTEMVDAASSKQLSDLYNQGLSGSLKDMSIPDLQDYMFRKISNVKLATTKFKAEDAIVNKLIPELKAKNPSLNTDALLLAHKNEMAKRLLNEDGTLNPSPSDSEILSNIQNPEYLSQFVNDTQSLNKILKDKTSSEKAKFKIGTPESNVTQEGYVGFWEDINQPTPTSGFYPKGSKLEIVKKTGSGVVSTPQGDVSIPTVPDNVYKNFLTQGGSSAMLEINALARRKFNGQPNSEGIGKLNFTKMSEEDKDVARKHVLAEYIHNVDQGGLRTGEVYNKPVTNVNTGEQKGMEGLNWLKGFKGAIESGDKDAAIQEARKLFAGNGSYQFTNMKIADDGGIRVEYSKDGVPEDDLIIKPNDPNYYYKIANLYQKVTGSDVKMEKNVMSNKVNLTNNPKANSNTYTINGEKYTHKELIDNGWTEDGIKKLKKN